MNTLKTLEQLYYFDGEFLTSDDFKAEQDYNREKLRLHNQFQHTWGIAHGFDVTLGQSLQKKVQAEGRKRKRAVQASGDNTVLLSSGMAVDSFGREIVYDGTDPALPDLPDVAGNYYLVVEYHETVGSQESKRIEELPNFSYVLVGDPLDPSLQLILVEIVLDGQGVITSTSSDKRQHTGLYAGHTSVNSLAIRGQVASSAVTGQVSVQSGSSDVSGTQTLFTSELMVGDTIAIGDEVATVIAITNDSTLTVNQNWTADATGATLWRNAAPLSIVKPDGDVGLFISQEGDMTISGSSNGFALKVVGDVYATNISGTSDARLKTDIQPIGQALDKVKQLRGVSFRWDPLQVAHHQSGSDAQIGLVSQEVAAQLPEVVRTREDGFQAINYNGLVGLLVEAIKEQQTQIEKLSVQLNPV